MIRLPLDKRICVQLIGEVDVSVAADRLEDEVIASPSFRIAVHASVIFVHHNALVLAHLVFGVTAGLRRQIQVGDNLARNERAELFLSRLVSVVAPVDRFATVKIAPTAPSAML